MSERTCGSCGAPLEAGLPGSLVVCRFCGTESRAPDERRARTVARFTARQKGRVWAPALIAVVVAVVGAGLGFVRARRSDAPPPSAAPAALHAANLETLGETNQTTIEPIDPAGVTGRLAAFDAIENVGWATRLARTWSPDARLNEIDWQGMGPDGASDLTNDTSRVEYRFASRTRDAAAREMAKFSTKILWSAFTLSIRHNTISAVVGTHTNGEVEGPVGDSSLGCPPRRAVEVWRGIGLPLHHEYNLELERQDDGSFVYESKDWGVKRLSSACTPL